MIDREHDLSITKQAEILKISRGSVYYLPRPVSSADLEIMRQLDRLHLEYPFAGSRMLRGLLALQGCKVGRRHVKTLMRRMGIEALYRRPRTTKPEPGHKMSNGTALAMVFKLLEAAQKSWRRLDGHNQLPKLVLGVTFNNGIEVVAKPADLQPITAAA
jgi:hypothetical protein